MPFGRSTPNNTMTSASRRGVRAVALLLVALVVGMCLTTSVEGSSVPHHNCNALTSGQLTLAKLSPPASGLWAATIEASAPLSRPSVAVWGPSSLTEELAPAATVGTLPSRSPPASP